jgi:hypothetical protein
MFLLRCRVFPNCTGKPKGERQLYVADALLEARELGGMAVRRPHDRVSGSTAAAAAAAAVPWNDCI